MPPGTRPIPMAYIQLLAIKSTNAAYTEPANIEHITTSSIQLSMGPAYLTVFYLLSASHPPAAMIMTEIGYGKEFLNLAKIYVNDAKYSGRNNSFRFKLIIF